MTTWLKRVRAEWYKKKCRIFFSFFNVSICLSVYFLNDHDTFRYYFVHFTYNSTLVRLIYSFSDFASFRGAFHVQGHKFNRVFIGLHWMHYLILKLLFSLSKMVAHGNTIKVKHSIWDLLRFCCDMTALEKCQSRWQCEISLSRLLTSGRWKLTVTVLGLWPSVLCILVFYFDYYIFSMCPVIFWKSLLFFVHCV